MDISSLPEDMLMSIFEYLDMESVLALYDVCKKFRELLLSKYLALRHFKLPFYYKRWRQILKHPYFIASKEYLVELDISGYDTQSNIIRNSVIDSSELITSIIQFVNIKDLNVSYTALTMPDCLEISTHLPKLVKLCADFDWPDEHVAFTDEMLLAFKQAFQNVEYLHFIGWEEILLDTDVLLYLSDPDKPKELRLTCIDGNDDKYSFDEIKGHKDILPYKKLIVEYCSSYGSDIRSNIFKYTQSKFDVIIINNRGRIGLEPEIFVSENLRPAVQGKGQQCVVIGEFNIHHFFTRNYKIIMWHRDYYTESFCDKIKEYLSCALPVKVRASNANTIRSNGLRNKTFHVCNCTFKNRHISDIKKIFPDTSSIKNLTIGQSSLCHCESSLPGGIKDYSYLLKSLTFLCLAKVDFLTETLKCVLTSCLNLQTLIASDKDRNFHAKKKRRALVKIDFMKASKSLKHICLFLQRLNVNSVLNGISLCPKLETIVLRHYSTSIVTKDTVSNIIKKCSKLNYIVIPKASNPIDDKEQHDILWEVRKLRPYFEHHTRDNDEWDDFSLQYIRERVFKLNDAFAPEDIIE